MPSGSGTAPTPGAALALFVRDGFEERLIEVEQFPFAIGRRPEKHLFLKDARVSRDHAEISCENGAFYLIDANSRHGTFLNGRRIEREQITCGDEIQFGPGVTVTVRESGEKSSQQVIELLSQIHVPAVTAGSEIEKLTLFLEAARALSSTNLLPEVLGVLIDTCLQLTGAERGFVYLRDDAGNLKLAAGRNAKRQALMSDQSISRSILNDTARSASEFIISDTTKISALAQRESIVAHDLRSVISIPLRSLIRQSGASEPSAAPPEEQTLGVLYLDSQIVKGDLSRVDNQILKAIASEAAILVENAVLMEAEEARRRYQQELSIAASIQRGLMPAHLPEVPFARVRARNISCREVGGDFYDVLLVEDALTVVVCDISGKGVSAALLASILQGLIYSHLLAGRDLSEVAAAANTFLCTRDISGRYATLFLSRLHPDGAMEWVRCGHVPPVHFHTGCTETTRWEQGCMPIGLLEQALFETERHQLHPGDRVVVVSDGITEAENSLQEMFGEERLETACMQSDCFDGILHAVNQFRAGALQNDDITLVELTYTGAEGGEITQV